MDQMQTVPGPSQAAFTALNNQIANYHTAITSGIATAQPGFSIMLERIDKFDKVCFLKLRIKADSAITARSHVATLAPAYKPTFVVRTVCPSGATYDGLLNGVTNCFIAANDGKVNIDVCGYTNCIDVNIDIMYIIS